MEEIPDFARHTVVELIASLPCYMPENVDRVQGSSTFDKSIQPAGLNSLGYGRMAQAHLNSCSTPRALTSSGRSVFEQAFRVELGQPVRYSIQSTLRDDKRSFGKISQTTHSTHA